MEGKCLSYSRGVAYHPVIDFLKSNFDIREEDDDSDIRKKVSRGLKALGSSEASTVPYLLELLSVRDSGIDNISLSAEARKDRIIEAVRRIALKGSEIKPLIMVFEDLHWIDKSSEDALKDLLEYISGARVFLIFTFRPDFVHTWGSRSYHGQVTLNRLSNRENLALVAHLLGADNIQDELKELILEKTEGVPFFVEEFVRSLLDQKVIDKQDNEYKLLKDFENVIVPSTVQDVIMARVDSLTEDAKKVLQTGAVLGREFRMDLIQETTGLSENELLSHLSVSKESELLYERGIYPQANYIFKHALTQEVVYNSLLLKRRKEIHEDIGKAIESIHSPKVEEFYELLAFHYSKSNCLEKAKKECEFFGAPFNTYSLLCSYLGLSLSMTGQFEKAGEYFEKGIDVLLSINHLSSLGVAAAMRGLSFVAKGDGANVIKQFEKSIKYFEEGRTVLIFSVIWSGLGSGYYYSGDLETAKKYIEKGLGLTIKGGSAWWKSFHYLYLSKTYFDLDDTHGSRDYVEEALKISQNNGEKHLEGAAWIWLGRVIGKTEPSKGDMAIQYILKGIKILTELSIRPWYSEGYLYLGELYAKKGKRKEALENIRKAELEFQHIGMDYYSSKIQELLSSL